MVGGTTGSRPWCDPVLSAHQTPRAAKTNIVGQTREGEGGGRGHNRDDGIRRERHFFLNDNASDTHFWLVRDKVLDCFDCAEKQVSEAPILSTELAHPVTNKRIKGKSERELGSDIQQRAQAEWNYRKEVCSCKPQTQI